MRTRYLLLTCAVLVGFCLLLFSLPAAHADGIADKVSATLFAAPNSGATLGVGASYQFAANGWIDFGVTRGMVGTDQFVGASTDLQALSGLIGNFLGTDLGTIPPAARVGGGYQFQEQAWCCYLAYSLIDF